MRLHSLVFWAFASISCGAAPASQEPHALPSATATTPPTSRAPSAALSKYVATNATLFAYADLEGLLRTKLGSAVAPNIAKLAGPDVAKCIDAVLVSGKELLFSSGSDGAVVVLRFDPATMDPKACPVSVPEPGIALFGDRNHAAGNVPGIALRRDEYLHAVYDEKPAAAQVSVIASDALFAIRVEADVPERMAREMSATFERRRATLPEMNDATADERETLDRLLRSTTFKQAGPHVSFAIDLREAPAEQAHDIGAMAALAISGVRKYLIASKQAEVRSTLPVIARSIVTDWERESLPPVPRAKKKLRSFPPVPTAIPSGTKYISVQADWAPWSPLRFEIDQPQYYQYEVRAAKDGLSADVIGRGDLDGDGKTSSFVITVKVKNDKDRSLELSPIVETDPDE